MHFVVVDGNKNAVLWSQSNATKVHGFENGVPLIKRDLVGPVVFETNGFTECQGDRVCIEGGSGERVIERKVAANIAVAICYW